MDGVFLSGSGCQGLVVKVRVWLSGSGSGCQGPGVRDGGSRCR